MLEPSDLSNAVIALLRGIGLIAASSVYLGGVLAWGIVVHDHAMTSYAAFAAGLTYAGYFQQIMWPDLRYLSPVFVTGSIGFAVLAGLIGVFLH
jgi:hypothetical protein